MRPNWIQVMFNTVQFGISFYPCFPPKEDIIIIIIIIIRYIIYGGGTYSLNLREEQIL
jgi:hypothetical protein